MAQLKLKDEFKDNDTTSLEKEIPTVTTLLRRKKLSSPSSIELDKNTLKISEPIPTKMITNAESLITQPEELSSVKLVEPSNTLSNITPANHSIEPSKISQNSNQPPEFKKNIVQTPLSFKEFKKLNFKKMHPKLLLLDTINFYSTIFEEIAFFESTKSTTIYSGRVGYGNPKLITTIREQVLGKENSKFILSMLTQNQAYHFETSQLGNEMITWLQVYGFTKTKHIFLIPHTTALKNSFWICTSQNNKINDKELEKIFTTIQDIQY